MAKVQVFDPAMCCPTGVCGPSVDPVLPRFASDLEWLQGQGVQVERFNLAQEPAAFAGNEQVRAALHAGGDQALPLVLVDGRVVAEGTYPSRETLAALSGLVLRSSKLSILAPAASESCCSGEEEGCCGGKGGCCDEEDGAGCGGDGSACC